MGKYFWKQQFDLPKGAGYAPFGPEHVATLLVIAVLITGCTILLIRAGRGRQERFIRWFPWMMAGMEAFKDLYLVRVGRFSTGYLPLHLCSLGVFVFLFYSRSRSARWRAFWSEIAVCLILPGSAAALLFPDWIQYYPVWNFMNLYSDTWHMNLILFPIFLLCTGRAHPTIRHMPWCIMFLTAAAVPIGFFNEAADTNYLFLHWPLAGSPIETIYHQWGRWWRIGYAMLVIAVVAAVYAVVEFIRGVQRWKTAKRGRSSGSRLQNKKSIRR